MSFFGFVLNGVLLALLCATIFFAVRLSLSLKAFRESRAGLSALISDLSRNIDQAQIAIAGLRESARDAGKDLQEKIAAARSLRDELDLMTESGENLAKRLENLATRAREEGASSGAASLFRAGARRSGAGGGFAIRDRDIDSGSEPSARAGRSSASPIPAAPALFPGDSGPEDEDEAPEGLNSKAERDLYAALRKGAKGGRA